MMSATLEDGSALPKWMRLEPPPKPFKPNIISSLKTNIITGLAVQGDIAFAAAYSGGLQIVNISDAKHPFVIAKGLDFANAVAVQRNVALVAGNGLQLVNISNPKYPKIMGGQLFTDDANGLVAKDHIALVVFTTRGLQLFNISDPKHPRSIGSLVILGRAQSVAVQGNLALVAVTGQGLQLVDISDPKHPLNIGSQRLPTGSCVNVQGSVALVADYYDGLHLVNISEPQHPWIISSLKLPGGARYVIVNGDMALVAADPGSLQLVNITHPTAPYSVACVNTGSEAFSVAVKKNFVLVGCRNGLKIIDLGGWAWTLTGMAPVEDRGFSRTVFFKSRAADESYQKTLRLIISSRPYLRGNIPSLNVRPDNTFHYRFDSEWVDRWPSCQHLQNTVWCWSI